jgi:predicted amino acid racemase
MRRKAPRVGDLVSMRESANLGQANGLVVECVGIHLYVRILGELSSVEPSQDLLVRRDSVDIIARADHAP